MTFVLCLTLLVTYCGRVSTSLAAPSPASDAGTPSEPVPEHSRQCASLIGKEICQGQLAYTLDAICELDTKRNEYVPRDQYVLPYNDTLVATVPDVERTPAGEAFDGALEAILTALDERGFIRDHARLARRGAAGVSGELAKLDCPGVIVFRPSPRNFTHDNQADSRSRQTPKFVLLVLENWHSGVAMKTFNHALDLVEKTGELLPLPPILGPYYSASADSLLEGVGAACERRDHADNHRSCDCLDPSVASGSMSSDFAIARLHTMVGGFQSFVAPQRKRKDAVFRWRTCIVTGACETDDSTTTDYMPATAAAGARGALANRELTRRLGKARCDDADKRPLENYASLRLMGTTFGVQDDCFPFGREVVFPGNVAALREESEPQTHEPHTDATAQAKKQLAAPKAEDQDKESREDSELIAWRDPEHSAQTFRVGLHEALRQTGFQGGEHIDTFWISNERIEDAIYLARLLKQELPDLRVLIDRGDLALLRTDYARELHGSLVVASWVPGLASRNEPLRYTLSRDQAAGIYRAALSLTKDLAGPSSAALELPKPRLHVIARQRFFALTGAVPVRFPPIFVIVLVLSVALAFWDLARIVRWAQAAITPNADAGRSEAAPRKCESTNKLGSVLKRWQFMRNLSCFLESGASVLETPTSGLAYVSAFLFARLMLFSVVAQVAILVCGAWKYAAEVTDAWTKVIIAGATLLGLLLALLGLCGAVETARRSVGFPCAFGRAPSTQPADLAKTSVTCIWAFWLATLLVFVASTVIPGCLILIQPEEQAFLARSLDVTSGASPIAVTVLCSLVLHWVGAFYARRLRVLYRSYVRSENAPLGRVLLERVCPQTPPIQQLYTDAAWPRHALTALVLCVPLLIIVAYAPPFAAWSPGGFTLESRGLHRYLLGCLIVLLLAIAFQLCQAWSLYRSLGNVLSRLAASELFNVFDKVTWPRTVTQHLWLNWRAQVELVAALWLYRTPQAPEPEQSYAALWGQVSDELVLSTEDARTKRAGLVVFELASWVRQLTSAMTSLTITIAGLLGLSWLYVFGVRRLLVTVSGFLTLCSVLLALVMFTSLQHDEVMQRIGRNAPGEPALHPVAQRVVTFVVLPLLLLLTTYYPGWWEGPAEWLQNKVSGSK